MMEKVTTKRLALYSGRTHPELAAQLAEHLDIELGNPNIVEFANGEIRARFAESVRGNDVFIVQSHYGIDGRSVNDSIMEQLIMIDAAYRASAKRITAVCPFYGYARQDRKAEGREPITARLIADMFKEAGAKRMISIDLHSGQIQGFFDGPVDHLTAMPVLEEYVRRHDVRPSSCPPTPVVSRSPSGWRSTSTIAAPTWRSSTNGGRRAAPTWPRLRGARRHRRALLHPHRRHDRHRWHHRLGRRAADRAGATEVWAMATHGVLSGPAVDRLKNAPIERVVLTNTLPLPPEKQLPKIEVLSVAPLIAEALSAVFDDTSVSEIFDGENLA